MLQIAFTFLVYPALILAYMGQAAYLSKHHHNYTSYQIGFYVSVPGNPITSPPALTKKYRSKKYILSIKNEVLLQNQ